MTKTVRDQADDRRRGIDLDRHTQQGADRRLDAENDPAGRDNVHVGHLNSRRGNLHHDILTADLKPLASLGQPDAASIAIGHSQ